MAIAPPASSSRAPLRRSRYVEVTCAKCGLGWEVSDRRERAIRAEGTTPICPDCRWPRKRLRPGPADYAFWTERFSTDEIRLLAAALFGPWE